MSQHLFSASFKYQRGGGDIYKRGTQKYINLMCDLMNSGKLSKKLF